MSDLIPYYLMPVTAMLGLYAVTALARIASVFYANATSQQKGKRKLSARERLVLEKEQNQSSSMELQSREFAFLFLSFVLSVIAYSFLVARVEAGYIKAERALFDPYALLGLDASKADAYEVSEIQDAFKAMAKEFHLSGQKDESSMEDVKLAYQALTETRGSLNYQRFGHPLGELEVEPFKMKIPAWLMVPTGPFRNGVFFIYVLVLLVWANSAFSWFQQHQKKSKLQAEATRTKTDEEKKKAAGEFLDQSNSVSEGDLTYMMNRLSPTSNYKDILFGICSAPDNVGWGSRQLEKVEDIKKQRKEEEEKEAAEKAETQSVKKDALDLGALVDEGGWDDDEDENKEETPKPTSSKDKKEMTKQTQLLEGYDEGVLGQKWVEGALTKTGQWPPKGIKILTDEKFVFKGETVDNFLDHPGLRRVLCMTMGRLNSQMLNTHPELLAAGGKKLIDQTYFRGSMEFRQRAGLLLEGILRAAMMLRSYKLVHSVLETVALFKIGCHNTPTMHKWFKEMMLRQNGCFPSLQIHSSKVTSIGHDEIATNDKCDFHLDLERLHAEKFLKAKVAICQKQGIPPQVALNAYREGWWLLLRCKRIDGPTPAQELNLGALKNLSIKDEQIQIFRNEEPENHLLTATPIIVGNIAQQRGKFQVKFKAPPVAGKYRFSLTIKSQDFLDADQMVEITSEVVDASTVERKPEDNQEGKEEAKKTK